MTCPCAFRPRRLARNGRCGRGIRHFPCIFCKKMGLAICPCAFRLLKTCGYLLACGIYPVNFRIKGFVTCPCAFRLWTLAQNEKSHTEVLPRDPVYRDLRSCQDTSYGDLIQRHCVEVCCKDLSQVSYINLAQKAFVERESTEIS